MVCINVTKDAERKILSECINVVENWKTFRKSVRVKIGLDPDLVKNKDNFRLEIPLEGLIYLKGIILPKGLSL